MSRPYLGIDNGVSGALGSIMEQGEAWLEPMPIRKELNYTKAKKWINRVDYPKLLACLRDLRDGCGMNQPLVLLERPMVNPGRFAATVSALRCMEATLIAIEQAGLPYQYVDSRQWQKVMLPSGLKGDELKKASLEVGRRMWPNLQIAKGADFDALLMAAWARRQQL